MPMRFIDDAAHWHARSDAAREVAKQMTDGESRRLMMRIALDYSRLAWQAERRRELMDQINPPAA